MSKVRMLRCLVNERLTAAAEEIFALFERTIAEYEEEVCRSKEENTRKQQLLDSGVQIHFMSAGPSLNQEITETPQIKEDPEEHSIKQEEEQLQEFTAVSVKSEEQSSLLQQRQSEHRGETQGEECGGAEADLDPHGLLHSQIEEQTDNDEDWEPPASSSTQQMETVADGDYHNQVTSVQNSNPISSDTVKDGDISGSDVGVKTKKYECTVCKKRFRSKQHLVRHTRVHTGEKPYSCSICKKTFTQKSNSKRHMSIHTGEKPYSCTICKETFIQKSDIRNHLMTHIREKTYSCSVCKKTFASNYILRTHMRTHTGEKPYSCSNCQTTFTLRGSLNKHMIRHHK